MRATELQAYVSDFETCNVARNLSPRTIEFYHRHINLFLRWASNPGREVNTRCIRQFIAEKVEAGRKPNTLRSYIIPLRAFFTFLVGDGVIQEQDNPMKGVRNPKVPSDEIQPLTPQEVKALLDTFDKTSLIDFRNYTMTLLMLETAMRVGEITRLRLEDVDLEEREIKVRGKGRKNRVVYFGRKMHQTLVDYLKRCRPWIAKRDGVLFPPERRSEDAEMVPHYLSEIVRLKMQDAGIWKRGSSAHRLRHTAAVSLIRAGASAFHVMKILGHSKLEMTQRYIQLVNGDLSHLYETASPLDGLTL